MSYFYWCRQKRNRNLNLELYRAALHRANMMDYITYNIIKPSFKNYVQSIDKISQKVQMQTRQIKVQTNEL